MVFSYQNRLIGRGKVGVNLFGLYLSYSNYKWITSPAGSGIQTHDRVARGQGKVGTFFLQGQ